MYLHLTLNELTENEKCTLLRKKRQFAVGGQWVGIPENGTKSRRRHSPAISRSTGSAELRNVVSTLVHENQAQYSGKWDASAGLFDVNSSVASEISCVGYRVAAVTYRR